MSLRDLGVFAPLTKDHPIVTDKERCWICQRLLRQGVRVALKPCQTKDETGENIVEAKPICATCHLRGTEITTPIGRRIVDTVMDCVSNNAITAVVTTTDGNAWEEDEVTR